MNIKVSYRDQIQLILLSILPAALVSGPLISEFIVNIIVIFFIIEILIKKKFYLFKENLFLYFSLFYFFLILSLLNSDIFSESALNVFFYFRFFLFAFAVRALFIRQGSINKYIYYVLSITIFIVVIDGYIQFFSGHNILGFPRYRVDRISGFFNDDLILGSYLLRIIPILLGLTLFFKDKTKITFYFNLLLILSSTLLIFLSGERASFLLMIILIFIIGILIDVKIKIKMFFSAVALSVVACVLILHPIIFDRYVMQLKKHIFFSDHNHKVILMEYMPMFKTCLKIFKANPILGLGPKSYRYYCNDETYTSYYPIRPYVIDNTIMEIDFGWKEQRNFKIVESFVKEGDIIDFGDKLFSYRFLGKRMNIMCRNFTPMGCNTEDNELEVYYSNKEGKIKEINYRKIENAGTQYINKVWFAKIKPLNSPDKIEGFVNSCNTHPHNIYMQLLAETGIIGFMFIFLLFFYILCIISKHTFNLVFFGKRNFSNLEICLLAFFFIILWPITTSGNFFNNWLNIISFYPLGFYLFEKKRND